MAEQKIGRGSKDRSRIDVNDPIDVEYVHHQFPWFSNNEIREVIRKHGPDRDAVQGILEKASSNRRRDDQ